VRFEKRKLLNHIRPTWVDDADPIFVTVVGKMRGVNQFAHPECWKVMVESVEYLAKQKDCVPLLLLAMPDHVHMIVIVPSRVGIGKFIERFKRASGYKRGIQWQRGGFDHRIRDADNYREKWAYVIANPVRAALVAHSDLWPYVKVWKRGEG